MVVGESVCLVLLANMTSTTQVLQVVSVDYAMPTRSFNAGIVEESAQKLFHYEKTMQHHLLELRKDPVNMKATYDLVSHSSAQTGPRWPPEPNQRDAYMKYMDEICFRCPSSDKE
jgi:hypothetical protein